MKYFSLLFICCFSVAGYAQVKEQVKADILLDNAFLEQMHIDTKFINSIEYTSEGFLLLSSINQFYLLGIGGAVPIFESWEGKTGVESFTVTSDGVLMMVSGNTLYRAYSNPSFIKVLDIPDNDMGISSKYKDVYVYDRIQKKNKKDYSIYQVSENKKITPLVKISTPILSVFELPSQLLFSTENILFSIDINTKKMFQILALPQEDAITSIVGDTINHAFYFSTDQAIYRIKDNNTEIISNDFGGTLKYDGEGLVVFNAEKRLIVRLRNNILYPPTPEPKDLLLPLKLSMNETPENEKLSRLLNEPRNLILSGQISQAIQSYAQLADKDNANSALLSEYAYALALGGIYEGALMNLDRAKLFGAFSEKDYFYAGQILALIGSYQSATDLLSYSSVPKWIYPKYAELYKKCKLVSLIPQKDDLEILFQRANYLASSGMNFQAIALYEQLLEEYPDVPLIHVGYSIPLEKLGLNKLAAEELETGILLIPDEPQFDETKQAFSQRLEQLKQPENLTRKEQPEFLKKLNKFNPQSMLYIGGMFSENYTSFSSRFGVYLSNSFNGALNLGISGNSSAMNFNIGVSGYQRLGNVVVVGFGVNELIGKNSNVFSITSSLGLSFINSKRNSSWDIFFNSYYPTQKGASEMYGFSIGKSFYFGRR